MFPGVGIPYEGRLVRHILSSQNSPQESWFKFYPPSQVELVHIVAMCGGGGGGGSGGGNSSTGFYCGGGGGGAAETVCDIWVLKKPNYPWFWCYLGKGGAGGAAVTNAYGNTGGNGTPTYFAVPGDASFGASTALVWGAYIGAGGAGGTTSGGAGGYAYRYPWLWGNSVLLTGPGGAASTPGQMGPGGLISQVGGGGGGGGNNSSPGQYGGIAQGTCPGLGGTQSGVAAGGGGGGSCYISTYPSFPFTGRVGQYTPAGKGGTAPAGAGEDAVLPGAGGGGGAGITGGVSPTGAGGKGGDGIIILEWWE